MRNNVNDLWNRLDKALGIFAVASVFCLIFVIAHRAIFDLDIWLHLKTGEYILQQGAIPLNDIFSFTLNAKPWVDHEWLFQVICSLIYSKWQAEGLIILQTYVILLSFFMLFLIGYRQIRSYLEVSVFVFAAVYACISRFNIRPDIFSVLFFSFYLYLLKFHIGKKRIWLLVLVQVFWVNMHGYFFLGPLVTFFFLASEFLRRKGAFLPKFWRKGFALSDSDYARLKMLFIFVVFACVFNPQGITGLFYPAGVFRELLFGTNRIFFKHIQELRPTFHKLTATGNFYYLMSFFCFCLMLLNYKKLKLVEIFLAVFFFLFGLTVRNIVFFVFSAYTIIVSYLTPTLTRASENIRLETSLRKVLYFMLKYGLAIYFITWIAFRVDRISRDGYYDFNKNKFASLLFGVQENRYPKGAVDFLLAEDIRVNLFNDFNSGAYLIGRAYPKVKVFIDGRTEMYGQEFFKEYLDMMKADAAAVKKILNKYDIKAALVSLTSDKQPFLIRYLYKDRDWKMVFFDETGVVFLKNIPQNQKLINKYWIDFKKYRPTPVNLLAIGLNKVYPWPYLQRASLFMLIKEESAAEEEAKEALRIMPDSFKARQYLGKIYLNRGDLPQALENLRFSLLYSSRNPEALVDIGTCLKEMKEEKSAINALQRAIKFDPVYAPAYYELGRVYLNANNLEKAQEALEKALKYAPLNPVYHYELGSLFLKKGKEANDRAFMKKAQDKFIKAIELNKSEDPALDIKIRLKEEEVKNILQNTVK